MQIVHETGHVLLGSLTGGQVIAVDLHPLRISQTVVRPNPHPVAEVWGGPLVGCLVPVLLWRAFRLREEWPAACLRFFAGFCLIANGSYLGAAIWMPVGDAHELVQLGTSRWLLGLFGLITIPAGLWLWNGLWPRLRPASVRNTSILLTILATTILVEVNCAMSHDGSPASAAGASVDE
jgi:hypothetical protein